MRTRKIIFLFVVLTVLANGAHAQSKFPYGDFWSLDGGVGMSDILVEGSAVQFVLDPKLWLSPKLMVGSKVGTNYSTDEILTFEGQVYLRWNCLHFGSQVHSAETGGRGSPPAKGPDIFLQGGMGMLSAYRGDNSPFDNVKRTRGSLLFDAATGVTIPFNSRWHIEPALRGGYPHIVGFAITVGYKIPLPGKSKIEYVEVIRTIPPKEIVKRTAITMIEYVLFGPDIGYYNVGVDHDAKSLNELVLNETASVLSENPDFHVRIEGHANPVTTDPNEADELGSLSRMRANQVADQLRARGVTEDQMSVISFGGTRTVTSNHDIWNRNRRVEIIIIQLETEKDLTGGEE